jgi:hypothetical protein
VHRFDLAHNKPFRPLFRTVFGLKLCLKEIQLPPDYLPRCNMYIQPKQFLQNKISVKVERDSRITVSSYKEEKYIFWSLFPAAVKWFNSFSSKIRCLWYEKLILSDINSQFKKSKTFFWKFLSPYKIEITYRLYGFLHRM